MDINSLLENEDLQLQRLRSLVDQSIQEEALLSSRLAEAEQDEQLSMGQKLADRVADFGGSWAFIAVFVLAMVLWIALNSYFLVRDRFDPYPFILLNLILSCLAALQAPIIMMSQNRQEDKDRRRSRSDFLINLKAELEVRNLHSKMDLLMADQMKTLFEFQKVQLEALRRIEASLNGERLKD